MIFGLGIDIIEVDRIKRQISKGDRFKERIYTSREIAYCEKKKNKSQNYAVRFAAKEAFFKAMGMGWRGGLTFKDVEIINDKLGKPEIIVHGKAKQIIAKEGIKHIHVSLSHIKNLATSIVTIEK